MTQRAHLDVKTFKQKYHKSIQLIIQTFNPHYSYNYYHVDFLKHIVNDLQSLKNKDESKESYACLVTNILSLAAKEIGEKYSAHPLIIRRFLKVAFDFIEACYLFAGPRNVNYIAYMDYTNVTYLPKFDVIILSLIEGAAKAANLETLITLLKLDYSTINNYFKERPPEEYNIKVARIEFIKPAIVPLLSDMQYSLILQLLQNAKNETQSNDTYKDLIAYVIHNMAIKNLHSYLPKELLPIVGAYLKDDTDSISVAKPAYEQEKMDLENLTLFLAQEEKLLKLVEIIEKSPQLKWSSKFTSFFKIKNDNPASKNTGWFKRFIP